jgi:subtilase family serine protease
MLADYTAFCSQYFLPDNSAGNLIVHTMPGTLGTNSQWARETCLDVEWAHAIAPNATILLVEAKDSMASSLYEAIDYAKIQSGVIAVSMSWGSQNGEFPSETSYDTHFEGTNIVFFASSGDNGSWAGVVALTRKHQYPEKALPLK